MSKQPTKKEQKDAQDLVDRVLKDFTTAKEYVQSSYWDIWDDNWKLYSGERVKVGYEGISDVTDPMVYSTVNASVANIASGKPKWDYVATRSDQRGDTKILNAYVDYVWECNNMSYKIIPWLKDMHIYGTAVFFVDWDGETPRVTHHPLRDTYFDPTATELDEDKCRYVIRRYLTSKEQLEEMEITDADGNASPMFTNLDAIPTYKSKNFDELDKSVKDMFIGSTLGKEAVESQIEVLEYWTDEEVIAVANRTTVIRSDKNPLCDDNGEEGMLPFIIQRYDPDGSLLYSKSMVEVIGDQQEMLNDITNQDIDNMTYALNNMWQLDPQFADMAPQIESLPGAVYPLPQGALTPIEKPTPNRDGLEQRMAIKQSMREAVAVDEITKGVSDNTDPTATEINSQQASAGRNFGLRLTLVENEGFKRMGILFYKMIQKFVNKQTMVRIVGPNGVEWKPFDPKDYDGDYEPKVQLDASVQAQQHQDLAKYQSIFEALVDNPMINQAGLMSLLLERAFDLDEDEVQRLIPDQGEGEGMPMQDPNAPAAPPPPAPGAPGMPMDPQTASAVPGASATPDGQIHETADLIKLYTVAQPDVQDQILGLLGLQPSQMPAPQQVDQVNQKMDMAMKIQQHERNMEQPMEPANVPTK